MSHAYPFLVGAPVAGLLAYCCSQIAIARCVNQRSPYFSLLLGAVFGLLATAAIALFALLRMRVDAADAVGFLALNSVAYLALAFGYFNFVNLTIASLRIRMLDELLQAGGQLAADSLLDRYSMHAMTAIRIERLVKGGHLVTRDGRFYSGKVRFLAVARTFGLLRRLVVGRNPCSSTAPGISLGRPHKERDDSPDYTERTEL